MARDNEAAVSTRRCAIYTRKSTEEGLEQEFNSLDAQREACAAYITSQRHEGWLPVDESYDDGGFSGGSMERPALQRLLRDIRAGRVDVVVVYKVDRLTRSLADFSKIVEVLDAAGASFVSVTQAFNTTTSMGRLTLNVLLSFAQFEREVTGERIRDKIAASRKRGMWMGGVVPIGYDIVDRKLVVVPDEAETVRMIFRRYIELGSVVALEAELRAAGIRSRTRKSRRGRIHGGAPLTRGALYLMLRNRIYTGEITHRGAVYHGEHEAILDEETSAAAAALLDRGRAERAKRLGGGPSILTGLVRDGLGRLMSPGHSAKGGKRYRYYFSRRDCDDQDPVWRIPAGDLEELVIGRTVAFLTDQGTVHDAIAAACSDTAGLAAALEKAAGHAHALATGTIEQKRALVDQLIQQVTVTQESVVTSLSLNPLLPPDAGSDALTVRLETATSLVRAGKGVRLVVPGAGTGGAATPDPALVKLIVKARLARRAVEEADGEDLDTIAAAQGHDRQYFGVLLRIAWLSPRIIEAVLDGRQPPTLTRQRLARMPIPLSWAEQEELLDRA